LKDYRGHRAVDGISFEAGPGKILGFLGPNGAGKSTTMRMLTGYLKPTSGCAEVGGFDVQTNGREVKRLIGYLPENTPLYTDMYVKEFLHFVAETYSLDQPALSVDLAIAQVGLKSEQHKKIHMLSKGYRQRVGLAQAIIHDPKVLVLDEPTSGLDPNQLTEIRELIIELGKNKTVILSTHIMQEAEVLCDDIIIISKGIIVANAPKEVLKTQYRSDSLETVFKILTGTAISESP